MFFVGMALILVTGLDNFAWIRNAQKVEDESGAVVCKFFNIPPHYFFQFRTYFSICYL